MKHITHMLCALQIFYNDIICKHTKPKHKYCDEKQQKQMNCCCSLKHHKNTNLLIYWWIEGNNNTLKKKENKNSKPSHIKLCIIKRIRWINLCLVKKKPSTEKENAEKKRVWNHCTKLWAHEYFHLKYSEYFFAIFCCCNFRFFFSKPFGSEWI